MEKRFDILVMSVVTLIMASGCQENETVYNGERLCTVQASFGDNTTRVGLVQDANSRDMITKWQEDDRINVILMKGTEYIDLGTVPIHDISENGKNCFFQYALPEDFDASEGYRLSCFTNNCKPVIIDGDVFYNASLIRMPISQFKARVMFDEYVQEENCFGSFLHYGTYELFHITNKSDKSINFSLSSFEADKCWYKETGGIRLYDNEFVVDNRFEKIIKSPSVTIPANSSDIIVSWYIPNGLKMQNARIVAEIDGKYVHSTNTKSSNVTLCTGVAYHMYATWDGNELKWGKGEETPAEAIDLGLPSGTLWASYNVGAQSPEDPGGYYAWGETEPKSNYTWGTYKRCDGDEATVYDIGSSIGMTKYDVAHVRWGGKWRIPSKDIFEELKKKCSSEWTQLNGQWGMRFTGPNGNSIFMPAAGYYYFSYPGIDYGNRCCYWSDNEYSNNTQALFLLYDDEKTKFGMYLYEKYVGLSVRPVQYVENPVEVEYDEGICSDYYPENNAKLEKPYANQVGFNVTFPWNGVLNIDIDYSDQPSMIPSTRVARICLDGSYGTVQSVLWLIDGLQSNKKYYWQVSYFDFESECYRKCSPIMSFTTSSE